MDINRETTEKLCRLGKMNRKIAKTANEGNCTNFAKLRVKMKRG